jgi:RNA recognition motif-containing protein
MEEHLRTLFIGDLSWFCQENDVFDAFSPVGEIEDIRLIRSKENKCLGYGFITFKTAQDAYNAMNQMNGQVLVGRKLK